MFNMMIVGKIAKNAKTIYYLSGSVLTAIGIAKGGIDLKNSIEREVAKKKTKNQETQATA